MTTSEAWWEAVRVHTALSSGHVLKAVPVSAPVAGLGAEHGEYAVGVFARSGGAPISYARYRAADVTWVHTGPRLVVGSPQFLTGYILGSLVMQSRARRRARRLAAPQWRPHWLSQTVVTTRRLWCEVATSSSYEWVNFNYDTIVSLDLTGDALTLTFPQSPPLRLAGAWVPWCAAVIAHFRFGQNAQLAVPVLHRAALMS
jgi:hypothetical protein